MKTEHPAPIASVGANARGVAPVNVEADELSNPNSPLAKRSIYFDFDAYVIKPEYTSLLEAHAKYLISHPQRHIMIQGCPARRVHSKVAQFSAGVNSP